MKREIRKMMAAIPATVLLLSARSTGGNSGFNENKSSEQGIPDYGDGLHYQPEWTKDAVIYEVNIQQYTRD